MNNVHFFEGTYQFNSIETNLNIHEDFILMKLSQQYEYRETTETLWAEVTNNGITTRYALDYSNISLIKL